MNPSPVVGAIDIGGTKIAAGLVGPDGQVLVRIERPTVEMQQYSDGLDQLDLMLTEATRETGRTLAGVGIGLTGQLDPETHRLLTNAFLPDWGGKDLAGDLSTRLGVQVAIENDADAAALGEAAWGTGRGVQRFIYVTISTGIGGGLVFDQRLYRGVNGAHPEIGHHVVDPSGLVCFCGARGCWETHASGTALARRMQAITGQTHWTAREVCQAAREGNPQAQRAIDEQATFLGIGLANLITLFAPQVIALGGGLMQSYDLFEGRADQVIRSMCRLVPVEKTRIVLASLGSNTGLAGAARTWYHQTLS